MVQNEKSVNAATAALAAHASALGIEGDASIQLWHLMASLSEWAAVNGVSVEAELNEFNETLDKGELDLPAAEMARKEKLQSISRGHTLIKGLPSGFTAAISSVLKPGVEHFGERPPLGRYRVQLAGAEPKEDGLQIKRLKAYVEAFENGSLVTRGAINDSTFDEKRLTASKKAIAASDDSDVGECLKWWNEAIESGLLSERK